MAKEANNTNNNKMKKSTIILSILALAGAFTAVSCNTTTNENSTAAEKTEVTAQKGAIVYFNIDRVVSEYDYANDLRSVVETKVQSIQQEVERRSNKLQKDANAFQDKLNKGLLTQSVAQQQQQKLQEQANAFQNYAAQKDQEVMEEQQVMVNNIYNAIKEYVDQFNAEMQFAMILATSGDILPAPVVTADPSLDVTDQIIEGINAAYVKDKKAE